MFDIANMMLMGYFSRNNRSLLYDIMITLFIGCLAALTNKNINIILRYLYNKIQYKYSVIELIGWENIDNNVFIYDYPQNMIAVNHYIYTHRHPKCFRYFNSARNAIYDPYMFKRPKDVDNSPNYLLGEINNFNVDDDIYVTVRISEIGTTNEDKANIINWKIKLSIKSYKHDVKYINAFIDKCIIYYDNYMSTRNKNKTYHFIFQGKRQNDLIFNSVLMSDFNNPEYSNYESFDNMFHSNKQMLLNDIKRLHDIEYYKKTGLKRKKGYLFYGPPGTGKTATVMAMSNYDRRHIIEIPLSRVKTNSELETILTLNQINNITFKPENVIILFDEIDIGTKLNRSSDINTSNKIQKNTECLHDKLNFGTLLSRLDGIGNYAGLIIVATCNNIDNIDRALYRDGRLNLVKFDNASNDDIINIIKQYYNIEIDKEMMEKINMLDKKISHAKLRCRLEHYDMPMILIDDLIKKSNDPCDSEYDKFINNYHSENTDIESSVKTSDLIKRINDPCDSESDKFINNCHSGNSGCESSDVESDVSADE